MSEVNPYESSVVETTSEPSFRLIDLLVVGLWIALPIAIIVIRRTALRIFEDFGVALPMATRLFVDRGVIALVASIACLMVFMTFVMRRSKHRKLFFLISGCTLLFLSGAYLMAMAIPFVTITQNLN